MPRPETQLREYFDAGVERVSAEDVIARVRVSEGGLQPLHTQRNFRPAWAGVGAFAATLIGLGGLASVLKLAPRVAGDAGAGAAEIVDAGGNMIAVWLIAAVVAAVVAGLTVWLVHRSSKSTQNEENTEANEGRVKVMETIERSDTEDQTTEKTEQRSRWPIVVIVLMAIALVGLIAWMTLAMRPNSPTAAPLEIVELIEDYTAAFNSYDADALEAVVADNYRLHSDLMDYDLEGVQGYLFELGSLASMAWTVTNDGPYYAVEGSTGTWYVSSEGAMIRREGEIYAQNGLWKVVDGRAGGPLVVEHFFMGG
jgi:flagellar basal body-associated protein FliL